MCKRGDIYFADMGLPIDCRQSGIRPVIIVSNDQANFHSQVITVVPTTTKLKNMYLPTHVRIDPNSAVGLERTSIALAEQVTSLDKARLCKRIGYIRNPELMEDLTRALQIQIGISC